MDRTDNVHATEGANSSPGDWLTIVSGLPRSGTSMMMQLLEAGGLPVLTDNVRTPDEDNPKGYYEFERVKQVAEDQEWVQHAAGKVVKMVYRLLYDMPSTHHYRVVFMRRRLEEVIASQEVMLQRHGKDGGQVSEQQLVDIYRRQLEEVYAWLNSRPNFKVMYVEYRSAVDEPERTANELNDFLGGRLDTVAMLKVPDKSLYRNRRS